LAHARIRQGDEATPEGLPGNRVDVVEVDDAIRWQSILGGRERELGDQVSSRSGQSGNHDRLNSIGNGITRQDEDWSVSPGG
jgi:hypothetical protein